MRLIEDNYEPNPTQLEFHKSNVRYKGFKGAKGSGKSRALIEECKLLSYEFPGNRGIIARLDLGDLKETTMDMFFKFIPPQMILQYNRAEHFVVLRSKDPDNPSRIKFAHAKDAKSFESGEIGFFALDEADEIPRETFQTLRTRLRLKGVAHYGMAIFNPPDEFHWLYDFFHQQAEDNPELLKTRKLFSNNTYENLRNLPSNYIEELKQTYHGDELNRFLYGEWGAISNDWAVWPEFNKSLHVAKEPIQVEKGLPILRCHDFGMYGAVSFNQFVDGQWRVLHPEIMEFGKGAEQMAPIVLSTSYNNYPNNPFLDISEPYASNRNSADSSLTCASVFKKHGIQLKIQKSSWSDRMGNVAYFMSQLVDGKPAFQVDPRNKLIISGLSGAYQFEENSHQRQANNVKDNEYTHICDTLQFAACYFKQHSRKRGIKVPPSKSYKFGAHNIGKREERPRDNFMHVIPRSQEVDYD